MLHAILLPTTNIKIDHKTKKFSLMESRDAFMAFHPTTLQYIEIRNDTAKHGTIPPMVNVIGEIFDPKEIIVDFDNISYKFFSIAKAVDIAFKMYFVLQVDYPKPCQSIWIFLNRYFFNLDDGKKPSSAIGTLMHHLKGIYLIFKFIFIKIITYR